MLPAPRPFDYQLSLFDKPIYRLGSIRNICGEFAELCTQVQTGAVRLKTDSRAAICPDLHLRDNIWFECKSVGRTNELMIYQHRHLKELGFTNSGERLFYWVWHHSAKPGQAKTVQGLHRDIAGSMRGVYIVDYASLCQFLSDVPVMLNTMYYSNHTRDEIRGSGWRFPIRRLREVAFVIGATSRMVVRGIEVPAVPVYSSEKSLDVWQASIAGIC